MAAVGVVRAAVGHAGHPKLQGQSGRQHRAAHARQRALHQRRRPGQSDVPHLLRRDGSLEEGFDVRPVVRLRTCRACGGLSTAVGRRMEADVEAGGRKEEGFKYHAISPSRGCQRQGGRA